MGDGGVDPGRIVEQDGAGLGIIQSELGKHNGHVAVDQLIEDGLRRAGEFTWGACAAKTLDVYREVAERRRNRKK